MQETEEHRTQSKQLPKILQNDKNVCIQHTEGFEEQINNQSKLSVLLSTDNLPIVTGELHNG